MAATLQNFMKTGIRCSTLASAELIGLIRGRDHHDQLAPVYYDVSGGRTAGAANLPKSLD
jgi:hypothetical protein